MPETIRHDHLLRCMDALMDRVDEVESKVAALMRPMLDAFAAVLRAAFRPTPAKRKLFGGSPSMHAGVVNGSPALITAFDDRVVAVVVLDVRDDRVAVVRGIADPDRLGRLTERWRRCEHDDPLIESW